MICFGSVVSTSTTFSFFIFLRILGFFIFSICKIYFVSLFIFPATTPCASNPKIFFENLETRIADSAESVSGFLCPIEIILFFI